MSPPRRCRMMQPVSKLSASPPPAAGAPLRLKVTSAPANLAPVRHAVEEFAGRCGFDEVAVAEIGLCINEALANVTRHAYDGATDKPVEIDGDFKDGTLVLSVRDWGKGKKPPAQPRHDPLTPGGLGLVCLNTLMDETVFLPQPDGMLLRMKRSRNMGDLQTSSELVPVARKVGDALVASVRGEIDLHTSPELRTEILDLINKNSPKKLVLNLAEVQYMDSSAIAVLVEALQKLRKVGGKVCLTNLQPRVNGLLEIARLGTLFIITKDEAEALAK